MGFQRSLVPCFLIFTSVVILASPGLTQEIEYSPQKNLNYAKENFSSQDQDWPESLREGDIPNFKNVQKAKDLTELHLQARRYRKEGVEFQSIGRLNEAISSYQKAILLDPTYVEPYNDLGIAYEMSGLPQKALDLYLSALKIDPSYLATYSNLAASYEERGDLKSAAYYWKKRMKLGSPDDYWAQRAKARLENISLVDEDIARQLQEEEIFELIKKVKSDPQRLVRPVPQMDEKKQKAMQYLRSAQLKLKDKDPIAALNDAGIAQHYDPSNSEIQEFIEEVHDIIKDTYTYSR